MKHHATMIRSQETSGTKLLVIFISILLYLSNINYMRHEADSHENGEILGVRQLVYLN